MEGASLFEVEKLALKKLKIYKQSKFRFFMRAVVASMFIGFGVIVAFKTGNFFYAVESPFAYPMAALVFGAAIILIAYGGGDLLRFPALRQCLQSVKRLSGDLLRLL